MSYFYISQQIGEDGGAADSMAGAIQVDGLNPGAYSGHTFFRGEIHRRTFLGIIPIIHIRFILTPYNAANNN